MKLTTGILWLTTVLLLGGCTPLYLGVSLRFQREDIATFLDEVKAVGDQFAFVEDAAGPKRGDWEILLRMRGKRLVRREPLALMVGVDRGRLSVGVGRSGGIGIGLRPEEIAMIRSMSARLEALRGFAGVEREVGMKLAGDASKEPNQAADRMPGSNAP